MSQSPAAAVQGQDIQGYLQNWNALSAMINRGQSFSGRERNCAFLNVDEGRWADVSATSGLDFSDDGRAIAVTDWDQDGDLDLWIANRTGPRIRFLTNELQTKNSFLRLRLIGKDKNRDAIGARVQLDFDDGETPLVSTLRAGGGFVSQSSKWVHFGLGAKGNIQRATIRWPDGSVTESHGLLANRSYEIQQAESGEARELNLSRPIKYAVTRKSAETASARVMLTRRLELPNLEYQDAQGEIVSIEKPLGKPLLLTLWASWCSTCSAELSEFAKYREQLADRVSILALCADDLATGNTPSLSAQKSISSWQLEMGDAIRLGVVLSSTMKNLSQAQTEVTGRQLPIALPMSFLFDAQGRLAVIYKGRVSVDQLLADVQIVLQPKTSMADAFPFPGRSGLELLPFAPVDLAAAYEAGGYLDAAEEELIRYLVKTRRAINANKLTPTRKLAQELERAYLSLAMLLKSQKRISESTAVLKQGLTLLPKSKKLKLALP